jgi:Tfp pilus assembly protein PilX
MTARMRYKKQKKIKGSAIAYGLVIMTAVAILLVSILGYIVAQIKFSANRVEREKAFQIAESGIYYYRWYLAHATDGMDAGQLKAFWQNGTAIGTPNPPGPGAYEAEYKDPETGEKIGKFRIEVDAPDPYSTIATVVSTGWTYQMPGVTRKIKARFRRPSWSEYAALANDFMRFGQGTVVYGKIHSNSGIRFDGLAHNAVSSHAPTYDDPDHSGAEEFGVHTHVNPPPGSGVSDSFRANEAPPNSVANRPDVFAGGRQFPVPEVSFNGVITDLGNMKSQAKSPNGTNINNCNSTGCYFDNSGYGRHIVLNANGTMSVRTVTNYDKDTYDTKGRVLFQGFNTIVAESSATSYTIPQNGVIFIENNIWLEGTINNKKVTIVAANMGSGLPANVFLGINNLIYPSFDGQSILGVVAQNNVEILKQSQNNLIIDGAFLAQSGRVGREYYSCNTWEYRTCTKWVPNCTLVPRTLCDPNDCQIWKNWNLVTPSDLTDDFTHCKNYNSDDTRSTITVNGSIATNIRYGFSYTDNTGYTNRNLNFDNNLLYFPPPYFPTGTEYSIDLWEEL